MKKVIKYIAEDGMEFDSEYDCYKYELNLNRLSSKQLKLLDEDGEALPISIESLDEICYMAINDKDALRWIMNVSEDYGFSYPTSLGKFCYDAELDEWVDAYYLANKLKKITTVLDIKLEDN